MIESNIFEYIKAEESKFLTQQIHVGDNWTWSFRNHVQLIFHLKNGMFFTGDNNWLRAFKNILEPILNLSYWMEGIEVKDVVFYVQNETNRVLSFLLKKYHDEIYVKENDLDNMFEEITESDVDYGGVLLQKTKDVKPEILALNAIAFCDQTDILSGPIAFKYYFNPVNLLAMSKKGWGNPKNGATVTLEELITLADSDKTSDTNARIKNKTTGKVIEVYLVRGSLPDNYLLDNDDMEHYTDQIQIVAFYQTKDKKGNETKQGVVLYRKKETENNLIFHTSKNVYGRALGRGIGESLLHPQIWTNFLTIHKMNMLESASKIPLYTDDPTYGDKNKILDMENLEITTIDDGKVIRQVPTAAPANLELMQKAISDWYDTAQTIGSAFDPLQGKPAVSGTTFHGQERTVMQGKGFHDRRRGQIAKLIEKIYREWIIPQMKNAILSGTKFIATLSSEELGWITDQMADNYANEVILKEVLALRKPTDRDTIKQFFYSQFSKRGNRHLLEILKDEFKDAEIKIDIDIAAKQKDLAGLSDKFMNIMQFVFSNPEGFQQAMQNPALERAFNDILEYSGLNPADFSSIAKFQPLPPQSLAQSMPQKPQLAAVK